MKCRYLLFVCLFVLASCSPRYYQREQVTRTVSQMSAVDSSTLRHMVDRIVRDELVKYQVLSEWLEQTTVAESFSMPDSTGTQHVTGRTTTTLTRHSQASATTSRTIDESSCEQTDSSSYHASNDMYVKDEEKLANVKTKGFMPWYVYLVTLVGATVLGIYIAIRFKRKAE